MEWVKTSNQLPDDGLIVLIVTNYNALDLAFYSDLEDLFFTHAYGLLIPSEVKHWINVPEKPKQNG